MKYISDRYAELRQKKQFMKSIAQRMLSEQENKMKIIFILYYKKAVLDSENRELREENRFGEVFRYIKQNNIENTIT